MSLQKPLILNNGKITQLPLGDFLDLGYGVKLKHYLSLLASYDQVVSIAYLDAGLRTERVDTITYTSTLFPDSDIVKTIFYLDVGKLNQRIEKIEYVGAVFSPDSLRKNFTYSLSGIRQIQSGFDYELF